MVDFNFFMPSEIIFERGCVLKSKERFHAYKRIFIVSGKSSAKLSGALSDVLDILGGAKSDFCIFDKIRENPLLSACYEGGKTAAEFGADLIVGIGGGSPLDAAKAVAMFAANPDMKQNDLFSYGSYKNPPLPLFAIPTTAGTGSEANPYSVITLDGEDVKKTFNYIKSYPKISFLDPEYTLSLPYSVTASTALDALCHCIESYLSVKSNPFSAAYAITGIKNIYHNLEKLMDLPDINDINYNMREELMLGSLCGGMAINTTGTCFPHPLGYNLTLINGLPHGKACALFIGEFLDMHETFLKEDIRSAFDAPMDKVKETVRTLTDYHDKFDDETLKFYVSKISSAKNFTNSLTKIQTEEEIFKIYKKCLGK